MSTSLSRRTAGPRIGWRAEADQPFGRLIKMADAANLCLFLRGPQSGVMTGVLIDHDQNVIGAYD